MVYTFAMSAAIDIADRIASAAACLHEHGHHQVAEALQLVLVGADDLPAAMGAAPNWRTMERLKARNAALDALLRHLAPNRPTSALGLAERVPAA